MENKLVTAATFLTCKSKLYVPKVLVSNDFEEAVIKLVGGLTISQVEGVWLNQHGHVVAEDVTCYTILYKNSAKGLVIDLLDDEVQRLLSLGEEAVLAEHFKDQCAILFSKGE